MNVKRAPRQDAYLVWVDESGQAPWMLAVFRTLEAAKKWAAHWADAEEPDWKQYGDVWQLDLGDKYVNVETISLFEE